MAYRITFYGKDYSPIESNLNITKAIKDDGSIWNLSNDELKNILLRFLQYSQTKSGGLIVNGKTNDTHELFSLLGEDKCFFGGVVGVLSGTIRMLLSDIMDDINAPVEEYEIEITLQIQSRFDVNSDGTLGKPYFLSTMLSESDPSVNRDFIPSNSEDFLFDFLLLFSFKSKLKEAYLKGYFRTYHRFEKNDDRIKGSIDVARHIKENMGLNNGKIAYSYRENSVNNYLNHLIVTAYSNLKKKYFTLVNSAFDSNLELKGIIENLKNSIGYPKYDAKTLIMKNLNAIAHPFYTEYDDLRKICLRILRNEGVSIFDGKSSEKVEGILFYIPDLWEKYLEKFLVGTDYYFSAQRKIKLIDYSNDGIYRQDTYPDYVFFMDKQGKKPFMILDVKFKEKWSLAVLHKGSFSGILEDYDKCIRDMNSIAGHSTGVIFPTNDDRAIVPADYIVHNISEYNKMDKFYTFPIYVPYSNDNYRLWLKEFRDNCKNVSLMIKGYIISEKAFRQTIDSLQTNIENLR